MRRRNTKSLKIICEYISIFHNVHENEDRIGIIYK